jgi:hypothetical protein
MDPQRLSADPARPRAGDFVDLFFPEETSRGVAFVLEQQVGDTWDAQYFLTAGNDTAGTTPSWAAVDEPSSGMDIGVEGPGPDRVVIPGKARPGQYRICTANAGQNFCAPLEIVEG